MKYAIIIPDGCADEPQDSLDGRTPLQAANIPAMDAVAKLGVVGRSNNTPESLPAGSDIALGPNDWAIRCNLVSIEDQIMKSFTAGHITSPEAAELIQAAQQAIGGDELQFYPGVSYRNLLVYRCKDRPAPFSPDTRTTPPHDLTDKLVIDDYPRGPGSDLLTHLMSETMHLFADHPVNKARRAAGKPPATNVWLWGLGSTPHLKAFAEVYGKRGTMITAVDLLRGLATLIGWKRVEVPGATGYLDTDYAAKGRYAVEALKDTDVVCVHVEATDEASHEGNAAAKVKALEEIDRNIVGPLHEALKQYGDYRILVTPDHPTPLRTKTHSHGNVPFALAGSDISADAATAYDDPTAARSKLAFDEGWRLMGYFLGAAK
jgi:2,3-bisphosphoglycerate-independent phosphoglycerate mutase